MGGSRAGKVKDSGREGERQLSYRWAMGEEGETGCAARLKGEL